MFSKFLVDNILKSRSKTILPVTADDLTFEDFSCSEDKVSNSDVSDAFEFKLVQI